MSTWRQRWFGGADNAGSGANLATPAGDGIANLIKYATDADADPHVPGVMPGDLVRGAAGDTLEFSYSRNKAAAADGVVCAVRWSDSLQGGDWHDAGVTESLTDEGATERVTVSVPRGDSDRRFIRLEVTADGETVHTAPCGVIEQTLRGGSGATAGMSLSGKPPYTGPAAAVGAGTVTAPVELSARLEAGCAYALLIIDGEHAGVNTPVTACSGSTLTVRDNLAGRLAPGDLFQLLPLPKISEIFGADGDVLHGGGSGSADLVRLWNPASGGELTLFCSTGGLSGAGWRAVGQGQTDYAALSLYFTDGMSIQKKSAGNAVLAQLGWVLAHPVSVRVRAGGGSYANVFAAGATPDNIGWQRDDDAADSLAGGGSGSADLVKLRNPVDSEELTLFYSTGGLSGIGWRGVGKGRNDYGPLTLPTGWRIERRAQTPAQLLLEPAYEP